jgi:hypothetical protein
MADLTYQATLDDKISPALAKIQQQTNKTAEAFGKFKSALAGLAIGAAIKSALSYADAISDISDATALLLKMFWALARQSVPLVAIAKSTGRPGQIQSYIGRSRLRWIGRTRCLWSDWCKSKRSTHPK